MSKPRMRRALGLVPPATEVYDDLRAEPETEFELASAFVVAYGPAYRFTPGMGWMTCPPGGDRWRRDDLRACFSDARKVLDAASLRAAKPAERKALASAKAVAAIVTLASADPEVAMASDKWDADPFALNTPAGIVDLCTGKLRERRAIDYVTQCTRVSPAAAAASPTWTRFLNDVFCGDAEVIEFMQRWTGYCLTGDRREQLLVFCYGLGANAKSTFWDAVMHAAGTYALKLPAHVLMQSQLQGHPTELAQLHRVRLAMSSELEEGQYWAEARIKELVGDGVLRARYMRQDYFEFAMTHKHVIVGNYKPRLKGADHGIARRFVLVPFLARFSGNKRDRSMVDKLLAEAPAILAWAIEGAVKWRASGLAIPASVAAASAAYMADNDDLSQWIDERCLTTPDAECQALRLYEDYSRWLRSRGQQPPSIRLWGDRMSVMEGITKRKSHGVMKYAGVCLKFTETEE